MTTTIALFGMCTGIAWKYSSTGRHKPAQIAKFIAQLGVRPVLADAACVPIKIPVGRYLREILDVLLAGNPKKPRD